MGGSFGLTPVADDSRLKSTTLLLPDGSVENGFDLVRKTDGACIIEDPRGRTVIMIAETSRESRLIAERYDEDGNVEFLPPMNQLWSGGGCGGYYNEAGNLVRIYVYTDTEISFI